jgi:BirA family biotin operon repressor/biotin-[acetyl-CoA-carboxylase] ligase
MMETIGKRILRIPVLDSTNRYFMDWLTREKPEEGTIVITDRQTSGKGMDGNAWESEPGKNLTFSFVLYPHFLAPDAQFYLNKFVALGLSDLVSFFLPGQENIRIKWPNDIYINDLKVAGTLIQNGIKGSVIDYAVVGVGLNVNQEAFSGSAANPVSMKIISGKEFDLEQMLEMTVERIEHWYDLLKKGMKKDIDEAYLARMYRFQQLSDYLYKGATIRAKITGVNRYGQLVLEIPGEKIIECDLKEIKLLTQDSRLKTQD